MKIWIVESKLKKSELNERKFKKVQEKQQATNGYRSLLSSQLCGIIVQTDVHGSVPLVNKLADQDGSPSPPPPKKIPWQKHFTPETKFHITKQIYYLFFFLKIKILNIQRDIFIMKKMPTSSCMLFHHNQSKTGYMISLFTGLWYTCKER